jgi:hypothetical protein
MAFKSFCHISWSPLDTARMRNSQKLDALSDAGDVVGERHVRVGWAAAIAGRLKE